jgi:hypothetical protein
MALPKTGSRSKSLLTRSEAAKVLGVHVSRIRQLERKVLPCITDERGRHLFERADVDDLARRRGRAPSSVDGELIARVFEMFRERFSLAEIVIETKLAPETVRQLFVQFSTPLGAIDDSAQDAEQETLLREWEALRRSKRDAK